MIDDLARPQAFPAPLPASVRMEETHASWVFLAGDRVWKLKKPVDFGFLNYSDRDKRRQYCEDEVRLGRRLAPNVYVGVVPVYKGADGFSFVGPGAIVEHAVVMRRLAEQDSARWLLTAGRLHPPPLRRLADKLAAFYATAPEVPAFGSPARLAALFEENFEQTNPWAPRFVALATLTRLRGWLMDAVSARQDRFAARVDGRHIRDGHGDLRLEHVYFPARPAPPEPLVIDPIEFNDGFRCGDAALDVAFLAMELEAAGRRDLGEYFLSSFAQASNDYDLYPVVDVYLCYRAWVRAKVACLVAADPRTPPDKMRRKTEEAARLFALADAYTRPRAPRQPVLAVGGMIGAGKSTVADALSLALALPVISSDSTRKHLGGIAATHQGSAALYTAEHTRRTYDELSRRARNVLTADRGVIMDASFSAPSARAAVRALARAAGRPFVLVEVVCDEATVRNRLRARDTEGAVSDAREELLPWFRDHYQPPGELPAEEKVVIDGRLPTAVAVATVLKRLDAAGD